MDGLEVTADFVRRVEQGDVFPGVGTLCGGLMWLVGAARAAVWLPGEASFVTIAVPWSDADLALARHTLEHKARFKTDGSHAALMRNLHRQAAAVFAGRRTTGRTSDA